MFVARACNFFDYTGQEGRRQKNGYISVMVDSIILPSDGMIQKSRASDILIDISATRLSLGDPVGFPPHPRGWLSIIVYLVLYLELFSSIIILYRPDHIILESFFQENCIQEI